MREISGRGFTIVELLVVIVVIGVLAAISLISYNGVNQKAVAAALQSDLSNATTALKLFLVENGNYPTTISTDCNASPDSSTNKCLQISSGNTYQGYYANNASTPKSFQLVASKGSSLYKVTSEVAPVQIASATMQPNVTPGAAVELHAAKANGGAGPGINSPLTTAWYDTSASGNNGTLTNFPASPWSGSGTAPDPYKLTFDGVDDWVSVGVKRYTESKMFTFEGWVITPTVAPASYRFFLSEAGPTPAGGTSYPIIGATLSGAACRARLYYRDGLSNSSNIYGPVESICDGLIHHIVATSDGATSTIYVDGVAGTTVSVSSIMTGEWLKMNYGTSVGRASQGQYYWEGSILVARIYPFALSSTQATANYNAGVVW